MTNEELIQNIQNHIDSGVGEYEGYGLTLDECRQVIKALESQPCEDCVSREDAINTAIEAVDEWDGGCNTNRATMICKAIKNLPSVTLQQTRWIPVSEKLPNRGDTVIATFQSPVTGMPFVATTHIVREPKEVVKDSNIIAWMPIMKPYKEK